MALNKGSGKTVCTSKTADIYLINMSHSVFSKGHAHLAYCTFSADQESYNANTV